jgi:putative lipoic acid-binding regulatory protein
MDFERFQELLDEKVTWPDAYIFKFVTKTDSKHQVLDYLVGHNISEKLSKNGKYTSITSTKTLNSSDEVVAIYKEVSVVPGVITL